MQGSGGSGVMEIDKLLPPVRHSREGFGSSIKGGRYLIPIVEEGSDGRMYFEMINYLTLRGTV